MSNISGKNIKKRRLELGMYQADLSAALSVDFNLKIDQSDISEMERGVRSIKDYELDAIAKILNVDPTSLLRENTD